MHDDTIGRLDPATMVNGNMDRAAIVMIPPAWPVAGAERRVMAQRCRPDEQDGCPSTLEPGQRSGVVDVHTVVYERPLPPAKEPSDVVITPSRTEHLTTRDHARLQGHQLPEFVHPASLGCRLHPPLPQVVELWKA